MAKIEIEIESKGRPKRKSVSLKPCRAGYTYDVKKRACVKKEKFKGFEKYKGETVTSSSTIGGGNKSQKRRKLKKMGSMFPRF